MTETDDFAIDYAGEAEYDLIMQEAAKEGIAKTSTVTLAAMLGDYRPLSELLGREIPHFYVRKPKLRQRIELIRDSEGVEVPEKMADLMLYIVGAIRHVVFVRERGQYRNTTVEELIDVLDDEIEAQKIGTELLGMNWGEKGGTSPNPTGDTSSLDSANDTQA